MEGETSQQDLLQAVAQGNLPKKSIQLKGFLFGLKLVAADSDL
jgi:hypothetical protein